MKILIGLLVSLAIDVVLAFTTLVALYRWPETCFGILFLVVLFWPLIWLCVAIYQMGPNKGSVDMIKMQNFYNLDALRRNSDRKNHNG